MEKNREIWVVIETRDGKGLDCCFDILTPAKEIASKSGGSVTAVVLGENSKEAEAGATRYGADKIISVSGIDFQPYSTSVYTETLHKLISKYNPDTVMISANHSGKDFAPRLACRLDTGITANCTELDVDPETGIVSWMMPAPGGIMATILCPDKRPQMGSICCGMFQKKEFGEGRVVPIVYEVMDGEILGKDPSFISSEVNLGDDTKNLADAEVLVVGGRGMGSEDNFKKLYHLAGLLGAEVAATRAAVDAGWAEHSQLIGQTGQITKPKLYIGFGVSGALQHTVGMEKSECVVAVNNDSDANIFKIADYAVYADATEFAEKLIAMIETKV